MGYSFTHAFAVWKLSQAMALRYAGRLGDTLGIGGEGVGNMDAVPTARQSDRNPIRVLSAQPLSQEDDQAVAAYFRDDEPILVDAILRKFDRQKLSRQAPDIETDTAH
jgi:hypothetical protein